MARGNTMARASIVSVVLLSALLAVASSRNLADSPEPASVTSAPPSATSAPPSASTSQAQGCPSSCALAPNDVHITSAPDATSFSNNASLCRGFCVDQGMPFYEYQLFSLGDRNACNCFRTCSGVEVNPTLPPVIMGFGPSCADIHCPNKCASSESALITSPYPVFVNSFASLRECKQSCHEADLPVYQYNQDGSCSCFSGCDAAELRLGMAPNTLGYTPACPLA